MSRIDRWFEKDGTMCLRVLVDAVGMSAKIPIQQERSIPTHRTGEKREE